VAAGSWSGSDGPDGGCDELGGFDVLGGFVLLGGVDGLLLGGVADCGISLPAPGDEQVSATLRTSVTFRLDWPEVFELVSELPTFPVTSTSLLTLSFSLEVSPVSWNMRPSSARSVKLPLWPCRQPRMPLCASELLAAPLCGSALLGVLL